MFTNMYPKRNHTTLIEEEEHIRTILDMNLLDRRQCRMRSSPNSIYEYMVCFFFDLENSWKIVQILFYRFPKVYSFDTLESAQYPSAACLPLDNFNIPVKQNRVALNFLCAWTIYRNDVCLKEANLHKTHRTICRWCLSGTRLSPLKQNTIWILPHTSHACCLIKQQFPTQ